MIRSLVLRFLCNSILIFSLMGVSEAHHLSGTVEVEDGKSLNNIIVYLEPLDSPSPPMNPLVHAVTQKGRRFNPELLVVSPGDKIQFLNDEDREIDHNIYSLSKLKNFDLGLGERGSVLEVEIKNVGAGNIYCSVHKFMEGRVVSISTRFFTILEKPGQFILPNIPSGKWKVNSYVFHNRYKTVPVTITIDKNSHENIVLKAIKK